MNTQGQASTHRGPASAYAHQRNNSQGSLPASLSSPVARRAPPSNTITAVAPAPTATGGVTLDDVASILMQMTEGINQSISNLQKQTTQSISNLQKQTTQSILGLQTSIDRLEIRMGGVEGCLETVGNRLTMVESRLTEVETRLTTVESGLAALETRLTAVETRITELEGRLTAVEDRMETVETKVDALDKKVTGHHASAELRFDLLEIKIKKANELILHNMETNFDYYDEMSLKRLYNMSRSAQSDIALLARFGPRPCASVLDCFPTSVNALRNMTDHQCKQFITEYAVDMFLTNVHVVVAAYVGIDLHATAERYEQSGTSSGRRVTDPLILPSSTIVV